MVRTTERMAAISAAALIVAAFIVASFAAPPIAFGQASAVRLETQSDVQRACRRAETQEPRELYVVTFAASSWRFGAYDADDGFLAVDTGRNLRAFRGSVELFPSRMEPVGFIVGEERAATLTRRATGLSLRVGFFLGFDDRNRTMCLLRPAVGVTTVSMDVAYLELVGQNRRVVARRDTDRLRAWLDDAERDAIPGEGPRGAIGAATRGDGAGIAPEAWQQAIAAQNRGGIARALGRCHAGGLRRGASDGTVVVRVQVDARAGRIGHSEVELSSIGDDETAECVARAVSQLELAPDSTLGARVVLSLPVRLLH
jgi:hypothetical protein